MESENAEKDAEKKKGFDKRITVEILMEMRQRYLQMPKEMTHEARGKAMAPDYPQFSTNTLEDYSRICLQVSDYVFGLMKEGKLSIHTMSEFAGGWDDATQKYIVDEFVAKGMQAKHLRMIKQLKREHASMGYAEAISRALGEIPPEQPRKEQKKTLDQILTQIADHGARWRALVSMALEMVRDEENSSGVHEGIFEKVFILRQLVGEQYSSINARVQRYMTMIRKKVKEQGQPVPEIGSVQDLPPGEKKLIDAEFTTIDGEAGELPAEKQ